MHVEASQDFARHLSDYLLVCDGDVHYGTLIYPITIAGIIYYQDQAHF